MSEPFVLSLSKHTRLSTGSRRTGVKASQGRIHKLPVGLKNILIIKMLQQHRHTGMDCRYPDYMDVMFTSLPWLLDSGNPCRKDVILALAEVSL